MNHFLKSIFFSGCAALVLVALSGAMITTDFYVKLDNGKGVTKIIHSSDRQSPVTDLPAGIYMFSVCDEEGTDLPVTARSSIPFRRTDWLRMNRQEKPRRLFRSISPIATADRLLRI